MLIFFHYGVALFGLAMAVFFFALFLRSGKYIILLCALLWLMPVTYEVWIYFFCTKCMLVRNDLLVFLTLETLVLVPASIVSWQARIVRTDPPPANRS